MQTPGFPVSGTSDGLNNKETRKCIDKLSLSKNPCERSRKPHLPSLPLMFHWQSPMEEADKREHTSVVGVELAER